MKKYLVVGICAALLIPGGAVRGASLGHSGSTEGIWEAQYLDRFSIGADYERIRRDIRLSDGTDEILDSNLIQFYLGLDLTRWLTLYGTYGSAETGMLENDNNEEDAKWSAGLSATLWHRDIDHPDFMAGRYALRAVGEYGDFKMSGSRETGSWNELFAAGMVTAELFVEDIEAVKKVPYSIIFYAGYAYSALDGEVESGGLARDFDETTSTGLLLGTDILIAHNLVLGAQITQMEHSSHRIGLRYHFR